MQGIAGPQRRRGRKVWPQAGGADQHGGKQRAHCRRRDRPAPVQPARDRHQMRGCGAEGQCRDQQAYQQSQVAHGPSCGQFHADRIDRCHAGARDEAQNRHRCGAGLAEQDGDVGEPRDRRPGGKQAPEVEAVGQAQQGAEQSARDEAALHAAGEQRLVERRQRDLRADR